MLPYQYPALPLPEAGKHTRLVRLSPGNFSDDLHVELDEVLLDGTSTYEALSYVWGSSADPVPLLVGPSRETTISVTQNLATALRYLRYTNESRTLWVDAVCIDQNNLNERSYQVTLMSDIYRAACLVIAWIGPEADDSSQSFSKMHIIGSSIDVNWNNFSYKPKVDMNNRPFILIEELKKCAFGNQEAHAVSRLLHRQWFQRLWIRQEIGLATQAIICCGKLSMPWHLFRNAIFFINSECRKLMTEALGDQIASFASRIDLVYRICGRRTYLLQHFRRDLAHVVCADPRDKIYGMLSLLHPLQQNMGIIPDYTQDVALVYQDAAIRFINHTRNLSILLQCELQDTPPHMPTWVPDWSSKLKVSRFLTGSTNASASFKSIAAIKGEGMLSVAGVAIATLKHVQPLHFGSEDDFQTMLTVLCKMDISNSATSNDTETSQFSAVCDALCAGIFRHTMIPIREDLPDFESVMQTFKARLVTGTLISGDVDSTNEWRKYGGRVTPVCRNRNLFVTTEGSVGIAPPAARPGDIVCVLLGCYCPILLRQTKDNTYQVIGESYVSGLHAGEALLGPLPEHLRPVHYYDNDVKGYKDALWNEHTGRLQFEDPRVDRLLLNPGFQVRSQGENMFPIIKTSVEALQNAGIAAQYFGLV